MSPALHYCSAGGKEVSGFEGYAGILPVIVRSNASIGDIGLFVHWGQNFISSLDYWRHGRRTFSRQGYSVLLSSCWSFSVQVESYYRRRSSRWGSAPLSRHLSLSY